MNNQSHLEAQKLVNFSHPLTITASQIIIDGDDIDTAAVQSI